MSELTHPLFELLRADAWIHESKALRWALGNDEATIYAELLSRHDYFAAKNQLTPEGYFFNTIEDLYAATHISVHAQRSAIKNLKNVGLIDTQVKGLPATRYFKIWNCPSLLGELLQKGKNLAETARKPTKMLSYDKNAQLDRVESNGNKYLMPDLKFSPEHELQGMYFTAEALGRKPRKDRHDG